MEIVQKFSKIVYKNNKSHSGSVIQTSAMFENKLIGKKGSAAMLAVKRSVGVAPEANLMNPLHRSTLTVKPRGDVTDSSKQGPMSSIS